MNKFSTWTHFWFGFWAEFGEQYSKCPSIKEFIDPLWNYEPVEHLMEYLKSAPLIATTSRLAVPWAMGAGDERSSISYRSDGVLLWLDDIDYYLIQQKLRLPNNFIFHIEQNNYVPPIELKKGLSELPLPPIG